MRVAPLVLWGVPARRRPPFRWLFAAALSSASVDGARRFSSAGNRVSGGASALIAGAAALFHGPAVLPADLRLGPDGAAPSEGAGPVAIRMAGPGDVLAMQRINEAVLPENYPRQFYAQMLADWPGLQLVACAPGPADASSADGPVIGYCLAKMEGAARGHITSIAVLPAYRNCGCATAIMREVTAQMRGRYRATSVTLNVRKSNVAALRVYTQKLGYLTEAVYSRYYQDGEDALHLALCIEEAAAKEEEEEREELA